MASKCPSDHNALVHSENDNCAHFALVAREKWSYLWP